MKSPSLFFRSSSIRRASRFVGAFAVGAGLVAAIAEVAGAAMPPPGQRPYLAFASGTNHSCAIVTQNPDGGPSNTVHCWGSNAFGQLGEDSSLALNDQAAPFPDGGVASSTPGLPASTPPIALAAGDSHTCALLADGTVWCWGDNSVGQLGTGSYVESSTAVEVSGIGSSTDGGPAVGAIAIAAGSMHTCALLANGTVSCWGSNSQGQSGNNSTTNQNAPVATSIGSGPLSNVIAITAGAEHTCAIAAGAPDGGAGTAGAVWCWGANTDGQLGNGSNLQQLTPVAVSELGATGVAVSIAAGRAHTCALVLVGVETDAGSPGSNVWCWGANGRGQLGDGSTISDTVPTGIGGSAEAWKDVAASGDHTCALTADGHVYCWGENTYGEGGDAGAGGCQTTPALVSGLSDVRSISLGYVHSCAVIADGTAQCWGNDLRLQLGNGNSDGSFASTDAPGAVSGLSASVGVSNGGCVAGGGLHTCGLTAGGHVKCWGSNVDGDLTGMASSEANPLDVGVTNAIGLCAGYQHTCALIADGTVSCWGDDEYGQLGDNPPGNESSPVPVSGLSNLVVQIACGAWHTCALLADGSLECWGDNEWGALGNGCSPSDVPVAVAYPSAGGHIGTVWSIAGGTAGAQNCALNAAGLYCWGLNAYDAVGDGTPPSNVCNPVQITLSGSRPARALGLGAHSCAVVADGTVQCWGINDYGEIGNGTTTDAPTPVVVSSIGGSSLASAVTAGLYHSCAQMADGTALCWGDNSRYQLGNNSTSGPYDTPQPVYEYSHGTSIAASEWGTCTTDATGAAWCWGDDYGSGNSYYTPNPVSTSYYP